MCATTQNTHVTHWHPHTRLHTHQHHSLLYTHLCICLFSLARSFARSRPLSAFVLFVARARARTYTHARAHTHTGLSGMRTAHQKRVGSVSSLQHLHLASRRFNSGHTQPKPELDDSEARQRGNSALGLDAEDCLCVGKPRIHTRSSL